jgi:hypothetical protein
MKYIFRKKSHDIVPYAGGSKFPADPLSTFSWMQSTRETLAEVPTEKR